jgi:hypothetical protein
LQYEINELKNAIRADEQSVSRNQSEGSKEKSNSQMKPTGEEAGK